MKHILKIEPAIPPAERHKIQDVLKGLGYEIHGGGTCKDKSFCDISFSKEATGNEEDVERLANLLHNSGLNGYSYPNNKSFPSWENYRKDIARGLIGRGINPKEATLKEYRDKEIELGF